MKLSYEALIAILQGKELHIKTPDVHVILHPPFDGQFLTNEQIRDLLYSDTHNRFGNILEITRTKKFEQKIEQVDNPKK
jgi:hypothetical protein